MLLTRKLISHGKGQSETEFFENKMLGIDELIIHSLIIMYHFHLFSCYIQLLYEKMTTFGELESITVANLLIIRGEELVLLRDDIIQTSLYNKGFLIYIICGNMVLRNLKTLRVETAWKSEHYEKIC